MKHDPKFTPYTHPAGGWGSVQSLSRSLTRERVPVSGARMLWHQNKPDGFACVSCAWAKPAKPHPFEFCEEGAKATTWEITSRRCCRNFSPNTPYGARSVDGSCLEETGRLTHPLRRTKRRTSICRSNWEEAVAEIAVELKGSIPRALFSTAPGRASLEASYMYALFARLYGNNNLPDSSNMCHESTSVGLPLSIGVPVGTVTLPDFQKTDCIIFFGHNTGRQRAPHAASLAGMRQARRARLSFSIRCASGASNISPIRKALSKCCPARQRRSVRNITRSRSAATKQRSWGYARRCSNWTTPRKSGGASASSISVSSPSTPAVLRNFEAGVRGRQLVGTRVPLRLDPLWLWKPRRPSIRARKAAIDCLWHGYDAASQRR